jgi:hypothetical protein
MIGPLGLKVPAFAVELDGGIDSTAIAFRLKLAHASRRSGLNAKSRPQQPYSLVQAHRCHHLRETLRRVKMLIMILPSFHRRKHSTAQMFCARMACYNQGNTVRFQGRKDQRNMPKALNNEILAAALAGFEVQKKHIDAQIAELRQLMTGQRPSLRLRRYPCANGGR